MPGGSVRPCRVRLCWWVMAAWSISPQARAQGTDSTRLVHQRTWLVAGGSVALLSGSLVSLNEAWYKGYPRSAFHFFDDDDEWLQMDKAGHAFSTYAIGRAGHAAFWWAGCTEKASVWIGGGLGFLYLGGIEYLDGRSSEWGFSVGDMAANTFGAALFIGQQLGWKEQRVVMKYSSHLTDFAAQRPDLLGRTLPERLLKDYNGTSIWLSANLRAFGAKGLPPWLNLAAGYGAERMISARNSPGQYRQFFLGPDISLARIRTKSKLLHTVLFVLDCVKVPLPALEYGSDGVFRGHVLYF
ncbi:MAG: DUF2279 domain-containing protein [Flavobacteriales bacterium]